MTEGAAVQENQVTCVWYNEPLRPSGTEKGSGIQVEGSVGQAQVDVLLNPIPQVTHADRTRVFVLQDRLDVAMARETFSEGLLLIFRLQPGHFDGVPRRQSAFVKGRLNPRHELGKLQTYYPIFRDFAESTDLLDCVEQLLGPNLFFHYSKLNMKPPAIGSVVEWHQDLGLLPSLQLRFACCVAVFGRRRPG
jgi:hypothetical protein